MRNYVVSVRPWFHCQNRETHGKTVKLDRYVSPWRAFFLQGHWTFWNRYFLIVTLWWVEWIVMLEEQGQLFVQLFLRFFKGYEFLEFFIKHSHYLSLVLKHLQICLTSSKGFTVLSKTLTFTTLNNEFSSSLMHAK